MAKKNKDASEGIITFLKGHPLIAVERLERKLNIPITTLNRSMKNGKIPKKYIEDLEKELSNYGY